MKLTSHQMTTLCCVFGRRYDDCPPAHKIHSNVSVTDATEGTLTAAISNLVLNALYNGLQTYPAGWMTWTEDGETAIGVLVLDREKLAA